MRKVEACTRALQLRSAVLTAAAGTSLRAAGVSDVTRSLLPPPLPTSSHAVPAPLPVPTAPFAASPLLDPYPLVSIDDPLEDNDGIECAVPKKKVSKSRKRIRNLRKTIPFVKYAIRCRICNKVKPPNFYCEKGCAIPGYMVNNGDDELAR